MGFTISERLLFRTGLRLSAFVFLFLCFSSSLFPQAAVPDQGKGKVVLNWYLHWAGQPDTKEVFYKYTYFIKNHLVLRRETALDSTFIDSNVTEDSVVRLDFTVIKESSPYLINLSAQKVRTGLDGKPKDTGEHPLEAFGVELMYKATAHPPIALTQIDTSDNENTFLIAGLDCFFGKGVVNAKGVMNGTPVEFAYTKAKLSVNSPINCFVSGFPYTILRLESPMGHNPDAIAEFVVDSIVETIPPEIESEIFW